MTISEDDYNEVSLNMPPLKDIRVKLNNQESNRLNQIDPSESSFLNQSNKPDKNMELMSGNA